MFLDSLYVYNTYEGLILIININRMAIFHINTNMKYLLKNEPNKPIVNEFAHLAICIADIEIL